MSSIAINTMIRRRRRHLTALAVVLALAGAVAAHHLPIGHIAMSGAMVVCVAVLPAIAAAARAASSLLARPTLLLSCRWAPMTRSAPPVPRARSSPVATVVLRL